MTGANPRADQSLPLTAAVVRVPVVVTIDGPAGTGKTTLAAALAHQLGGIALHTGRHYRAAAIAITQSGTPPDDELAVAVRLRSMTPGISEGGELVLNGSVMNTNRVESPDTDRIVSQISNNDGVRSILLDVQRAWVQSQLEQSRSVVIEGRDAGTRIAPDAHARFFLHASPTSRAERRLTQRGHTDQDLTSVHAAIVARDAADEGHGRATPDTPGIVLVETGGSTPESVLERIWKHLKDIPPPLQGR